MKQRLMMFLVLTLVMGAVHAAEITICINGRDLDGNICNTGSNPALLNQQLKATAHDALEIILHSTRMVTGIDGAGYSHFVGAYTGDKFTNVRNTIFSCTVSPNAQEFNCLSWNPIWQAR